MKYDKLEKYVSEPRLKRYYTSCNNSKSKAQKLYRKNLLVSKSFYPVLNLFEIFLRNVIDTQLIKHFSDKDWIINQKTGFMSNKSLKSSKYFLRESVNSAEKKLKKGISSSSVITSGKIISELSFGFWSGLFYRHHYKLLSGDIIHCFPNKPKYVNRKYIEKELNKIRSFRNRIYHNEPICFNGSAINFNQAQSIKKNIYDFLEWIDPDLVDFIRKFDNIDMTLKLKI